MTKKEKDVSNLKKTAEAYGTISESEAQKATDNAEKITSKIISDVELSEEEKMLKKMKEEEIIERELKKIPDRRRRMSPEEEVQENLKVWKPKTKLGKEVQEGKIKNIDQILDSNKKILEPEIVDSLLNVKFDLLSIGQSKGKFGGGKRRAWRQTQRKTKEGNVPTFSAFAVVGDEKGHIGVGYGRAKETLPGRDKAIRKAKLNLTKITRDCASFDCNCGELHTVPFKVEGKGGSCRVVLIPAPQGTGLVAANELKKILKLAGIKDVYSKTFGTKATTFNLAKACMDALEKTNRSKK